MARSARLAPTLPRPARLAFLPSLQRLRRPFAQPNEADHSLVLAPTFSRPGAAGVPLNFPPGRCRWNSALRAVSGWRRFGRLSCRQRWCWRSAVVAMAFARDALLRLTSRPPIRAHFRIYFPVLSLPIRPRHRLGLFLYGPRLSSRTYKAIALAGLGPWSCLGWQSELPPDGLGADETGTVASCSLVISARRSGRRLQRLPPMLVFLGDASHWMYILHIPISLWWKWLRPRRWDCPCRRTNFAAMARCHQYAAPTRPTSRAPLRRWLLRRRTRIAPLASASSNRGSIE